MFGTLSRDRVLPVTDRVRYRKMADAIEASFELLQDKEFLHVFESIIVLFKDEISTCENETRKSIPDLIQLTRDPLHCYFHLAQIVMEYV